MATTGKQSRDRTLVVVVAVYAPVAAAFDAFTWPMRIATAVPIAGVAFAALAYERRLASSRNRRRDPDRGEASPARAAGYIVWALVIAAAGAFQLGTYRSSPRDVYPTLSSLAGAAFGWWPVRAIALAAWLWLGVALVKVVARR